MGKKKIISAFNFSDEDRGKVSFDASGKRKITELISSDYDIYSGSTHKGDDSIDVHYNKAENYSRITVHLPPFTGVMYISEEKY